jgi:acetyltransferase-like isoleucine patch superfamily enzyme
MKNFAQFKLAIRNRETSFYAFLYEIAKKIKSLSVPVVPKVHSFLYNEWDIRTRLWHEFWRIIYYEPIFKSQCVTVGSNFKMEYAGNGTTRVLGCLNMYFGSNVTIFDNTMLIGQKVFDHPELYIGDNTYIGPRVSINVAKKVLIGRNCMITSLIITDNPGHPVDNVISRLKSGGGSPHPDSIRPVSIGDFCFLALNSVVYPGTTVGDGVVARIGTHLSKSVPPFCLVGGNPWKIIKKLPIPEELRSIVGDERFESYLEVHKNIN